MHTLQAFNLNAAKTRTATAVGTTKKELKWLDGDNIDLIIIGCGYTTSDLRTEGNYGLACFDCNAAAADILLGTGTAMPESLDSNLNVHFIPPGQFIAIPFTEFLSYDGNAGFLGNGWVRSVNATDTLDMWIGATTMDRG